MENKKANLQKQSLLKTHNQRHRNLIGKYKQFFDPLLLPKLAIVGYQIKPDPSCQIFVSKMLLFDKNIIQKQNKFISTMKKILQSQQQNQKQLRLKAGAELGQEQRQVFQDVKFQEERLRYGQLLNSRLKDLNELIYHVERHEKQPELEKECRTLLEIEISRVEKSKRNLSQKKKTLKQLNQEPQQKLFNMFAFRQEEIKKKKQLIKKMYEQKEETQRKKVNQRILTQPSEPETVKAVRKPSNLKKTSKFKGYSQDVQGQMDKILNQDNAFPNKSEAETVRISKNYNYFGVEQYSTERPEGSKNFKRKKSKFLSIKTQEAETVKTNSKVFRFGKTVRLNIQQSKKKSTPRQLNYQSNKPFKNLRANIENSLKNDDNIRNFGSKKNIKKGKLQSNKSIKCEQQSSQDSSSDLETIQFNDGKSKKQVRFNEDILEIQRKNYVNKLENLRKRNLRRDRLKYSAAVISMSGEISYQKERSRSNQSKYSKQNSKQAIRREAGFQETTTTKQIEITEPRKKKTKGKRNGMKLGAEANKNLMRLLNQSTIEDLMVSNQYEDRLGLLQLRQRQAKNGNQNKSKEMGKHIISKNNNILLEVDFQAGYNEKDKLRDSQTNQYVKNNGFRVSLGQLGSVRDFVKVTPYHHQQTACFYGGERIEQINFEIITNQLGQYSFNREFIYKMKKVEEQEQEYQPYKFPTVDPSDYLSIELGKQLIKNSYNIRQKTIHQ